MAWSWSHTPEAYQNAENHLRSKDREWLEIVYAEWEANDPDEADPEFGFRKEVYDAALERIQSKEHPVPDDALVDSIWERMSEQATCTNGGHEAWACPSGCGCHLLSFSYSGE